MSNQRRRAVETAARPRPTDKDYQVLANFRLALRRFLALSEQVTAEAGLTPQRYQALLVIKTFRRPSYVTVSELAEQLLICNNSAAELVCRLARAKLVKRGTDPSDRRRTLVTLTPLGERRLAELVALHMEAHQKNKQALLKLFDARTAGAPRSKTSGSGVRSAARSLA